MVLLASASGELCPIPNVVNVPADACPKLPASTASTSAPRPQDLLQGSGFRVQGSGFRVQGSGFGV